MGLASWWPKTKGIWGRNSFFFVSLSADRGGLHPLSQRPWGTRRQTKSEVLSLPCNNHKYQNSISVLCPQVLGRRSPFPLILLPQFGGYWIEGTNHEPKEPPDAEQPPCPASHVKLETNSTAKIYRKNFMGKVREMKDGMPAFGR